MTYEIKPEFSSIKKCPFCGNNELDLPIPYFQEGYFGNRYIASVNCKCGANGSDAIHFVPEISDESYIEKIKNIVVYSAIASWNTRSDFGTDDCGSDVDSILYEIMNEYDMTPEEVESACKYYAKTR